MSDAYREAGVDIEAADKVVGRIAELVKSTRRPGVLSEIGGFGALFESPRGFDDPVLVSGADGVGTKLLLAQRMGIHDTIGIDLVAMNVNDVAVVGAEPLFFLDYFATGGLEPDVATTVIAGIAEGCKQAGCALIGGEISEMPGMYAPGHYDLAGFCVGVVERARMLDGSTIAAGDVLVGVPSTGVHSNGFSLIRKICDPLGYEEDLGFGRLGEVLLTPTRIYVSESQTLLKHGVKGLVHITGGGFVGNLSRVLPQGLSARLETGSWPVPPVFGFLQQRGELPDEEMIRVFNQGIGLVAVVPPEQADAAAQAVGGHIIGEVVMDGATPVEMR